MSRPISDLIRDYEADPARWEVIRTEAVPSTRRRNRGGQSVQDMLRNKDTGEEMVRHTLLTPSGVLFGAPHFRLDWK